MARDRNYTGTFSMKHLFMSGKLCLDSVLSRSNGMYAQKYITSIYISSQFLLVSLVGLIYLQERKIRPCHVSGSQSVAGLSPRRTSQFM